MSEAYIIDAIRTPVGRRNGALAGVRADELAAKTLSEIVERTGVDPNTIDDVVMGCVTQLHEQGVNVARNAALIAGFPVDVTGTTVNRLCGSSQQALNFAAMGVASGHQDIVIAAGVESMSRIAMGSDMFLQGEMVIPSPKMSWKYNIIPRPLCRARRRALRADPRGARCLLLREPPACCRSRRRRQVCARARHDGRPHRGEGDFTFANDEGIRRRPRWRSSEL